MIVLAVVPEVEIRLPFNVLRWVLNVRRVSQVAELPAMPGSCLVPMVFRVMSETTESRIESTVCSGCLLR